MGDPTVEFFTDLAARGEHALPEKHNGTIRFDLSNRETTEHWYLTIRRGNVTVTRENTEADCVFHGSRDLFDRMASGLDSWGPLLFRGEYVVQGNLRLLGVFRRLLPGQPGAHHPRDFARSRR
jgi:hypothetical protein